MGYFRRIEKQPIIVVDDVMGSGKTTWALRHMGEAPHNQKFIYITPYTEEFKRVQKALRGFRKPFFDPSNKNSHGRKLQGLKQLIDRGENIVSSHALFEDYDHEILSLLLLNDYTLIMDEVSQVVQKVEISAKDIAMLKASGAITWGEDGKVEWLDPTYSGKFNHFMKMIKNENVFVYKDSAFIWMFPVEIFQAFRQVFILTYLFDGQIQKYYFDMHKVPYIKKSVGIVDPEHHIHITIDSEGNMITRFVPKYELIDYRRPDLSRFRELIHVYEGKLNDIGRSKNVYGHDAFTYTQLTALKKSSPMTKRIKGNLYNYSRNICKAKANEIMWTCPKDAKGILGDKGYSTGFISSSKRATNEFRHKSVAMYALNKFLNPSINKFFEFNHIEVDQDMYAISELLQWLFRGQIRDDKPMEVFIPSERMRGLLLDWLDGQI